MVSAGSVDPFQVHLNVVALIIMALLISFLALVVYLERILLCIPIIQPLTCSPLATCRCRGQGTFVP